MLCATRARGDVGVTNRDLSGLIVPVAIVFGTRTFGRIAVNSSPLAWIALNLCLVCYYGTLLQVSIAPCLIFESELVLVDELVPVAELVLV